jgi:TfoX/Sxy family transcriptional regulator of competence genes
MAYDVELEKRLRAALEDLQGVSEKKMFGGIAFLVDGHMAIAASGQGDALVRVDPADSDHLVASTAAEIAVMQGRPMAGWLRVPVTEMQSYEAIATWVTLATRYARSLPAKN